MDVKRKSSNQEKRVAKELDGRVTPASGAIENFKGDVRNDMYLVECKTTDKNHYVLNYTTWDKIRREALKDGMREPMMQIDLNGGKSRLAILDADVWYDLEAELRENGPLVTESTSKASKQVKWSIEPYIISFVGRFKALSGAKDVRLLVLPWSYFLDFNERQLKDME